MIRVEIKGKAKPNLSLIKVKKKGGIMNIEKFADMLLKSIEKMEMPVADVLQIKTDNSLFGVEMPDDSQFLIKIGKCNTEEETLLCVMDEVGSRIHEIFEKFTNSWEYNHILMKNKLDIDWLMGKLEMRDYQRVEDYILDNSSRNDELIFRLGFRYAWSLFTECAEK